MQRHEPRGYAHSNFIWNEIRFYHFELFEMGCEYNIFLFLKMQNTHNEHNISVVHEHEQRAVLILSYCQINLITYIYLLCCSCYTIVITAHTRTQRESERAGARDLVAFPRRQYFNESTLWNLYDGYPNCCPWMPLLFSIEIRLRD